MTKPASWNFSKLLLGPSPSFHPQNIPLGAVKLHMNADLLNIFQEKSKEFSTLKRVYCANPTCSRFLGEQIGGSFWHWFRSSIKCPADECGTSTCTRCKNKVNSSGHSCDVNAPEREVLTLGRRAGWARCPGCEQMIELNHGCFHMTCRCRTEFCYVCKARWKTCACPQWNERRLLAAAEARTDAQLGHGAPPLHPAAVRVIRQQQPPPIAHVQAPPDRFLQTNAHYEMQRARHAADLVQPRVDNIITGNADTLRLRRERLEMAGLIQPAHYSRTQPLNINTTPPAIPPRASPVARSVSTARPAAAAQASSSKHSDVVPDARSNATPTTAYVTARPLSARVQDHQSVTEARSLSGRRTTRVSSAPNARGVLIRRWMDRLRDDHEYQHERWKYHPGGGRCETCHHHLPLYLFVSHWNSLIVR